MAQLRFERVGNQQGLSQSTVHKIFQDKRGFFWFATRDGLNKYDGYNFTVFRHNFNDPNTISSSNISTIAEDNEENLWVGMVDGGINKLDKHTGKFIHYLQTDDKKDISKISVSDIITTQDDKIWIATYRYGLLYIDIKKNSTTWKKTESAPITTNDVPRIIQDRRGNIIMGGHYGEILEFSKSNTVQRFRIDNAEKQKVNQISCLYLHPDGDILIGTRGNGLHKMNLTTKKTTRILYNTQKVTLDNYIMALAYDQQGTLWIGTESGVILIKKQDFTKPIHLISDPDSETGLNSLAIQAVFVDRDNNVWIGTWEAGLNIHFRKQSKFVLYRHKVNSSQSLLRDKVNAIVPEDNNKIWIGTNSGLSLLDRKNNIFKHFVQDPSTSAVRNNNDFNFLYKDKDGDLITLTWGIGLRILKKGTNNLIAYPYQVDGYTRNITCLVESKKQNLMWVGSQDMGILTFDKKTGKFSPVHQLNKREILLERHINAILEDSNGKLWISSFSNGVFTYDPQTQKIEHFQQSDRAGSLKSNNIFQVFEDSQKRIWIATNGGGLCLYQPQTHNFRIWTTLDGLPNNTIKGIMEDKHRNLWLATNEGLSNFIVQSNSFKNYSKADGLQGSEFLINSYCQNALGEMFFGGTSGMNVFHPDSLTESNRVPPIYITGLRLFNKPTSVGQKDSPLEKDISETQELTFNANQNVFSFEYTALDFQQLKNNQYAYIMEGFDYDWNYVGTQRIASYTNLNAGEYTFRVKASNSDGVWNSQQAIIKVIILPPWYKTWWAFGVYALLITGAIYALRRVIQVRERFRSDLTFQEREKQQIQELDRIKTNFFTNISHEFRTPLTLIISPLEKYLSENPDLPANQRARAESIYRNAKQLQKLINQLLDLSKLEAGRLHPEITHSDLVEFIDKTTQSFQDLAVQKNISLQFQSNQAQIMAYFDSDIVEKIITNLLSNAFKFSKAGGTINVHVTVNPADNEKVIIKVSDTGIGIAQENLRNIFNRFYQVHDKNQPQVVGTGVGLALCKELAELHRGEILVSSKIDKGTTFSVHLPIAKNSFDIQWIKEENTVNLQPELVLNNTVGKSPKPQKIKLSEDASILLIAEDNEDLRAYIKEIFVQDFQIIEADNGKDALDLAKEHLPDLIISDWMMPLMTGVELCENIKTDDKTSHIPVVILTSKNSNESKQMGLETGADDYITKPFNANLLEIRVKNILENRRKLRELFGRTAQLKPKEITLNSSDEHFLERAIKIVEENINNASLDIEFLEEELKMSNMQLYRKLKSLTNLSGNEFIKSIRLKKAVQLLETESFTIAEVSYKVGFNDPSYFSRMFKKEFGKAPSEYLN
jgi:signal transduction histidine kinase/ligand-binding sensor domain-containing protein/DNA-binding response OmpR family regulator